MTEIQRIGERALAAMHAAGFDASQVSASISIQDELNVAHNEASLLRSTEDHRLQLIGIVDGRKASTEISDLSEAGVAAVADTLYQQALMAPVDEANCVSVNQSLEFEGGPQAGDLDVLATKVSELLEFQREQTPLMKVEEGSASHRLTQSRTLTSAGTDISSSVGAYSLMVMGTATDGEQSSSFNYAGGTTDDLSGAHATEYFGIAEMLRETELQISTHSLSANFSGDVVLSPLASSDLLAWLVTQLGDMQLISGNSVYRDSVGEIIASPLLSIASRFDGPGLTPVSGDACVAHPLLIVDKGQLTGLLPSLYGSQKTGLSHSPTASGWQISSGSTPKDGLCEGVDHGAWVGRLSMGRPASNGDFSGVIKGSFEIVDGSRQGALSEVMISGNMSQMLKNISAVSRETLDSGSENLPWMRIGGLYFS